MADRYVSSLAGGGGSGTSGSPWTLAEAASSASSGDRVFVKADGTYNRTATLTFAQNNLMVIGYTSTIGDDGIATIAATSSIAGIMVSSTGVGNSFRNLVIDGTAQAQTCLSGSFETNAIRVAMRNFTVRGFNATNQACVLNLCEITGGASGATSGATLTLGSRMHNCVVSSNQCHGIVLPNYAIVADCVIAGNTGASSDGVNATYSSSVIGCVIHSNGRHGINFTNSYRGGIQCQRNVITNNGTRGILHAASTSEQIAGVDWNAFRGNGTSAVSGFASGVNDTTLTADPYTNAAGGDFSINNTAGGGAVLRALNFALPGISTTRYPFGGWYPPSAGTTSSLPPFRITR